MCTFTCCLLLKLQCPPRLLFTASTVVTDAVVQSPSNQIHSSQKLSEGILHPNKTEQPNSLPALSDNGKIKFKKSTQSFNSKAREEGATTKSQSKFQDRLHSTFGSFIDGGAKWHGQSDSRVGLSSLRPRPKSSVSSKPGYPPTSAGGKHSSSIRRCRTPGSTTSSKKNVTFMRGLNTSVTAGIGPHKWEECPRRSPVKQRRVRSAPASPTGRRMEAISTHACRRNLFSTGEVTSGVVAGRPPFVVRHVDSKALTKWNFCGEWGSPSRRSARTSNQLFPKGDTDLVEWGEPLETSSFSTSGGKVPDQHS